MHYQASETVELKQEFSESIPCWFETMQRRKAEVYTVISFHFHCKRPVHWRRSFIYHAIRISSRLNRSASSRESLSAGISIHG